MGDRLEARVNSVIKEIRQDAYSVLDNTHLDEVIRNVIEYAKSRHWPTREVENLCRGDLLFKLDNMFNEGQKKGLLRALRYHLSNQDITDKDERIIASVDFDCLYPQCTSDAESDARFKRAVNSGTEMSKKIESLTRFALYRKIWEGKRDLAKYADVREAIDGWLRQRESKYPLYSHDRASRAFCNATIENDSYREGLILPELRCIDRLICGEDLAARKAARKRFANMVALGSGTGLFEFASFIIPYVARFGTEEFRVCCVDNGRHEIDALGMGEVLDLQSPLSAGEKNPLTKKMDAPGFNRNADFYTNRFKNVDSDMTRSEKLRVDLDNATPPQARGEIRTYLIIGRTFGNFYEETGLLDAIFEVMLPGDELIVSASTVKRDAEGNRDLDAMKAPYLTDAAKVFMTESAHLAGWKDVKCEFDYEEAGKGKNDTDADLLFWEISGYCPHTERQETVRASVSKRYDVNPGRNQLAEIFSKTRFRDKDVSFVGVEDAEKTGIVVAYARKTHSSIWLPRFRKASMVVGALALAGAVAGGVHYCDWLEKGKATQEKANALACSSDQEGLCYLSGRQDDSTQLLDMVLAAECGLDKVYPAAARVIECAGGMDPDRIDSLRRQLFDKMKSDHFLLFAVERHGIIELFKQLESQGSSNTSLDELIVGLPQEMRIIADMTTQYEITRTLDITAAKAKIDRLPDTAGNVEAIVNFAYLNNRRGELDDAINYYERALNITKSTGVTKFVCFEDNNCFTATNILHMLMDAAAAERDFAAVNRHLDEFRSNVENGCGWDNYALAHIHLRMREYGTAMEQFEKGLGWERAQNPRVPALMGWTYHKFADMYSEKGLFDDAVRYAREGIAIFKGVGDEIGAEWCNIALARALINKGGAGDAEAALDALDNIQQLSHDENARIYALFNKGRAYMRLGDMKSARAEFSTASDVVNASEGDSMRRHYDLFMAEYWTGLSLFAGSNSSSQALPHFRRAYAHLNVLIEKTNEDIGESDFFAIEELACLRFIDPDKYAQRRGRLGGFILDHKGLFNEFLLDQYGD